jgi:hypothetical protein
VAKLSVRRSRELIAALKCAESVMLERARAQGVTSSEHLSLLAHRNTLIAFEVDLETALEEQEAWERSLA